MMADDTMRNIRVFQVYDLFLAQFNRQSAHGIFQMCNLRCPDDRCSNRLLLQQPGKRDMNAWNPALFCDFCNPPYDLSIGFGCRIVFALCYLIGFGMRDGPGGSQSAVG